MTQGYEVTFNDVPLHEYMLITGVEKNVLPPRTNLSKQIPSMYGEHYLGHTYGVREVTITGYLESDSEEERTENLYLLADILNVDEPVKVVTSDDPDKYFFAVPDGVDQNRIGNTEEVKIKLKCYDVYKYALEDDFFQPDSKNVVTVNNDGSVEAYPVSTIEFSKKAYFLQCTNYAGETVLVGQRPDTEKSDSTGNTVALKEPCEEMTNWLPAGNVVQSGFEVMGTGQVNGGGYAILCNDYGTSDKGWHGVALRRNIGSNVRNFEVAMKLVHNSKGDVKGTGAGTTPPSSSNQYKITADPSLRIRQSASTSSKILGKIPKGKVVSVSNISKNWGKVTYNGVTGYIYMTYTSKVKTSTSTSSSFTVQATDNVRVRKGAGTKYATLTTAKKGTKVTVKASETKSGWYKVTVDGKTGYSYSKYWKKVSSTKMKSSDSAESKLGRIEVYGFGQNQERLFRCVLRDSEAYYEYTQPEIFIGSTKVLDDKKSCPDPKTTKVKDKDNKGKFITKKVDSGRFGEFNEFEGYFYVSRETNSKGQQVWKVSVEKHVDGKVTKTLKSKALVNANYPTADLNHIVVWFGQYKDNPVVDVMTLNHLVVKNTKPVKPQENRPIFWAGDELTINHNENKVYLNGRPYMEDLDIGSQFFSVPTGESEFIFASDDKNLDIEVGLTKRYI